MDNEIVGVDAQERVEVVLGVIKVSRSHSLSLSRARELSLSLSLSLFLSYGGSVGI